LFSDKFQDQELDKEQINNNNKRFSKWKDELKKIENCVPRNDEEITNFLKNVNWAIKRRGIFMVAMLKIASMPDRSQIKIKELENWKDWNVSIWYKLIMEKVLYQADKEPDKVEIMAGYDEVFTAIEGYLDEYEKNQKIKDIEKREISEIRGIIQVAQDKINAVKLS
jgi:hypothetical protein